MPGSLFFNFLILPPSLLLLLSQSVLASPISLFDSTHTGVADQPWCDWSDQVSTSFSDIIELQLLLDSSNYGKPYRYGEFDCLDMSAQCEQWLERHHYRSWCFCSVEESHVWVVTQLDDGGYVSIETTFDPERTMGLVSTDPDRLVGFAYDCGAILAAMSELSSDL